MGKELHKKALEEVKCHKVFGDMKQVAVSKTTQEDKPKREGSILSEEKRLAPIKNTHEYDDDDDDDSNADAGDHTSVDDGSDTGFFDEADSEDYISDDGLIINKVDGLTDFDEFRRNILTDDVYDSDSADSSDYEEGLEGVDFIMTPSLAALCPSLLK